MEKKSELTAADLAIYYRAECKIVGRSSNLDDFHGFAHKGQIVVIDSVLLASIEQGLLVVKPILRPLSDMTEEESNEVQCAVDKNGIGFYPTEHAEIVRYLLSLQFDLFGWIDAGLAIDKTKL